MSTPIRSMADLARQALDVQDACNLSGVVHSFSKALSDLRQHGEGRPNAGNPWLHRHPITLLWVDKIASLTGAEGLSEAYKVVNALAAGEKHPDWSEGQPT